MNIEQQAALRCKRESSAFVLWAVPVKYIQTVQLWRAKCRCYICMVHELTQKVKKQQIRY